MLKYVVIVTREEGKFDCILGAQTFKTVRDALRAIEVAKDEDKNDGKSGFYDYAYRAIEVDEN